MVRHCPYSFAFWVGGALARLFVSYKREEQDYAFAIREWLIGKHGWLPEDIFVDLDYLRAGTDWAEKLFAEAERAQAMLFLASEASLEPESFCYRELRAARGTILAVTIKGLAISDERLARALPQKALARQIAALDQQPTVGFDFISLTDGRTGTIALNRTQVESIAETLRELGVAPNSFKWAPSDAGPYPGLRPLMEGDEAVFCGRDVEIRDHLKALEELRGSVMQKAYVIQAPSGAGKSSFLRAGLWSRLRHHAGFTPLGIVRVTKGVVRNPEWGLVSVLADKRANLLSLSRGEIEQRVASNLSGFLADLADKDRADSSRRTLLLGIDQAEEMTALSAEEDAELDGLLARLFKLPKDLDLRMVLTVRDDGVDDTLDRLAKSGLPQDRVTCGRLARMPATRLSEVVVGPAKAAQRVGWPLDLDPALADALATAASSGDVADALPILALALQRMVSHRRAPDGRIALRPVDAREFIATAVADATREACQSAGAAPEDLRRLIVPKLATWDPKAGQEGSAKRLVASASELFTGSRVGLVRLAEALVNQRLLSRSRSESGPAYEIAHEALLRNDPLGPLISERRDAFEQVRMLEAERRDWHASGGAKERLGRTGRRLEEALALLADEDFGTDLKSTSLPLGKQEEPCVADYLVACAAHEREQIDKQRRIVGRAFVKPANQALEEGLSEHALRLAATGALLADDLDLELVPELWGPAARSIYSSKTAVVLKGHTLLVTVTAFSFDGQRIVTGLDNTARCIGSWDNTARVWDAESGKEISLLQAHSDSVLSASFSPDGRRIVTGSSDNTARVWDAESGKEIALLKAHSGSVQSVSFSPDGRRIVTGADDNTARVWDAQSGKEIACLRAHRDSVLSASFSPDGRRIVTGSSDNTARVWDIARTEAIVEERAIVITAALARGVGYRTEVETDDLLIEDASEDMFAEAMARLGARGETVPQVAARLRTPFHPNCYLSPTQLAEKFGALSESTTQQALTQTSGQDESSAEADASDLGGPISQDEIDRSEPPPSGTPFQILPPPSFFRSPAVGKDDSTAETPAADSNVSQTAPLGATPGGLRWQTTAFWLAAILITAVAAFIAGRW